MVKGRSIGRDRIEGSDDVVKGGPRRPCEADAAQTRRFFRAELPIDHAFRSLVARQVASNEGASSAGEPPVDGGGLKQPSGVGQQNDAVRNGARHAPQINVPHRPDDLAQGGRSVRVAAIHRDRKDLDRHVDGRAFRAAVAGGA